MKKDFDNWNNIKKKIDLSEFNDEENGFPSKGEVWMCHLGRNIGYEQNGSGGNFSRPIMIIKKFNNHMFWCVPLSTKQKEFDFYYNFTDPDGNKVSAILAQMKLISIKRMKRKLYEIPKDIFKEIKEKLRNFLR